VETGLVDVDDIYNKARTALRLLMKDLLCKDQFNKIDNQYTEKLGDYLVKKLLKGLTEIQHDSKSKVSASTVLKILLRAQRMEQNKQEIGKILQVIFNLKLKYKQILEYISDEEYPPA